MSALEMLPVYLSYPFVQAALVVGVLVALCCSLFGMTLVLNHQSFIGDSLSYCLARFIAAKSSSRDSDEAP